MTMTDPLRAAAQAVIAKAETDDNWDGEYMDYLVPADAIEALRAALAADTARPGLDAAWAEVEAALPEHDVIKRLERDIDGRWSVWTGVPDPLSRTADYGYGPGKGDGGWGGDWADGATPTTALRALAARLTEARP